MIKKNIYHKNCYWKKRFDGAIHFLIDTERPIEISRHELKNLNKDRKHAVTVDDLYRTLYLCKTLKQKSYLFEVETEYNTEDHFEKITKAVIRTKYDDTQDITMVIRQNKIVTAWLNSNEDKHFTLNEKSYVKGVDKHYKGCYNDYRFKKER
jgi:hypothetical protein